ncbi:hypothetical protein FKW77_005203 [Venturia effusa]|uniref:C2H2-type domain-containing protein n=1 Tax=Venturia effusa TaxID=50376 RepID=A0A517LIR6_9PEZI|nr:hypothetical protein FKW77_005203 [Venturia effusa]
MTLYIRPRVCKFCGIAIHKRRDVEDHIRTYHSEQEEDTSLGSNEEIEDENHFAINFANTSDDDGTKAHSPCQQRDNGSQRIATASQSAIESLTAIEKQFNEFRLKRISQELADIEREEALLHQDLHPDQIKPLAIIKKFVSDRLRPAQAQYKYSVRNAKFNLESGIELLSSQYCQEVREIREKYIKECRDDLHRLQKRCAAEELEGKEATEGVQPKGRFSAHYKTDDREMFVKERKIARTRKR